MLFVIGRIDWRPGKTTTIHACIVFTPHIIGMNILMQKKDASWWASDSFVFAVLFVPSIRGLSSFFLNSCVTQFGGSSHSLLSSHAALLPSLFSREGALRDVTKTAATETQVTCLVTQRSSPPSSPGEERCMTRQKRLRGRRKSRV